MYSERGFLWCHRVSRFSSKYDREDTDRKFDGFRENTRSIRIGSFFYKCHEYGVIPDCVPHYESVGFPVEVLPGKVQRIVFDTHNFQNFPIDYIAPSLLFVACAACGNSTVIQIINGWCEKPILYLAIVGDRGTNKTSCFEFALGLEVLAYGCGESELTEVSLRSVKGAIARCYYFIGCGLRLSESI